MLRRVLIALFVARAARRRRRSRSSAPTPARTASCRSSSLPPGEQLPAAPFLIGSYAFFLVLMMFYLWTIWRRIGKVEQEMRELERRHGEPRSGDSRPLHLHPGGPAGRRRDRLDSRIARRARRVRDGAEAARGEERRARQAAESRPER